ncbi:MAG: cation diffusion facilitator family transporter [Bermanella sp.]
MERQSKQMEQGLVAKKNITIVGAVVNVVLSVLKIVFGWLGQSQALIADGIHSFSDLLTDMLVFFAADQAAQEADEKHPYGHARFETLATVILGAILVLVAGTIVWNAASGVFAEQTSISPSWVVLLVAVVSIVAKEVLFRLTMRVAEQTKSPLLKANAWHHRSDAISSLIVLVGVGLEMMGYAYFDAIAALVVGLMVAKIGLSLMSDASKELVDTALEPDLVKHVKEVILGVAGVRELHFLRTRQMGGSALIDVHILVEPKISVSEGHIISEKVRVALVSELENLSEVMVHIDPEDDEIYSPSLDLPLRDELLKMLDAAWGELPEKSQVQNINLHYLDGKVLLEIELPLSLYSSAETSQQLVARFTERSATLADIHQVKVLFA